MLDIALDIARGRVPAKECFCCLPSAYHPKFLPAPFLLPILCPASAPCVFPCHITAASSMPPAHHAPAYHALPFELPCASASVTPLNRPLGTATPLESAHLYLTGV
eukprot:scaffold103793_cov18-Tisochrysis_lutea.AAC.1